MPSAGIFKFTVTVLSFALSGNAAYAQVTCDDFKAKLSAAFIAAGHGPLEYEREEFDPNSWRPSNADTFEAGIECDATGEFKGLGVSFFSEGGTTPIVVYGVGMLMGIDPSLSANKAAEIAQQATQRLIKDAARNPARASDEFTHGAYTIQFQMSRSGLRYRMDLTRDLEERAKESENEEVIDDGEIN